MTYTLYRVHSFACDWPGCDADIEDVAWRKRDAWQAFAKLGWTRTADGSHYCPKHSEAWLASLPRRQEV